MGGHTLLIMILHTVDGQTVQDPASMRYATPFHLQFQHYGSVPLFLILGFDLFREFEGANQTKTTRLLLGVRGVIGWITRV